MNTTSQDLAALRAALIADEALFTHRAACTICNSNALCTQGKQLDEHAAQLRGVALGSDTGLAELDTIMSTAESIVRDIVQVVRAGHLDHDAQTAFQCWISEALLQQPTTHQIDLLCRAAGLPMSDRVVCGRWAAGAAGPIDADTMKQRIDDLQATISGLRREWSECAMQRAALHGAGQTIVNLWAQSEFAQAIQALAALLPSHQVGHDEDASG